MTRARTFCRDGLVGAAGRLNSSVLIDCDIERLTTYSDPRDPPGAVGARGCALTFSLVLTKSLFKTGVRLTDSVTDLVVVLATSA
jgi:hypothetical protein